MLRKRMLDHKYLALTATLVITASAAIATDKHLEDGVAAYNAGNYSDAVGLFGQALSTEYNNPLLHYYYGNALNKMKQKPDAIREYRIALSLQPDGKMADYCKQALEALGAGPLGLLPAPMPKPGAGQPAAGGSNQSRFRSPSDEQHFNEMRDAIIKEADVRIKDDEHRVDQEIKMIQTEVTRDVAELSSIRGTWNTIQQVQDEGQRKIQALKSDLERKKGEIQADAAGKVSAIMSRFGLSPDKTPASH